MLTVEEAVPVDLEATRGLARRLASAANAARQAEVELRGLCRSCSGVPWEGASAEAFLQRLSRFPAGVDALAVGYDAVAAALTRYAQDVEELRGRAERAASKAQDARRRASQAARRVEKLSDQAATSAAALQRAVDSEFSAAADTSPAGPAARSTAAADRAACEQHLAELQQAAADARAVQSVADGEVRAAEQDLVQVKAAAQRCARTCASEVREATRRPGERHWWDALSVPGPNDLIDLANGLIWPSVKKAEGAARRHADLNARMLQLHAARHGLTGAARKRANKAYFDMRRQVRAANVERLQLANRFPARYLPRSLLYYANLPLDESLPVLRKIPLLSVPLTGVGVVIDREKMSTEKAVVKNVASTAAGIAVAATLGGPVFVGVLVGAGVGYGVGWAVEHWGDDVARGASSALDSAGEVVDTAKDDVGEAASRARKEVGKLWARYGW